MWWSLAKIALSGVIIAVVSGISQRLPRVGAVVLSLPVVSLLAFAFSWRDYHDLPAVSRLARETLVLVPLGLPFFIPLAFADRLNLEFWPAFISGLILASATISLWLWLAPRQI